MDPSKNTAAATDVNTEYFTSFEQTGPNNFLSYISWLSASTPSTQTALIQSNTYSLDGRYSARFTQTMGLSPACLETKMILIPAGVFQVTFGGWFYIGDKNLTITATLEIDGSPIQKKWSFTSLDMGQWAYRSYSVNVTEEESQQFYGTIQLNELPGSEGTNQFWLDECFIDFSYSVYNELSRVIVGDIRGTVYGLNPVSGVIQWTYVSGGGIIEYPPAISNRSCYFTATAKTSKLFCLNAQSGGLNWSLTLTYKVSSQAVVYSSRVFVMGNDGNLYYFDLAGGANPGSVTVFSTSAGLLHYTSTSLSSGILYITSDQGIAAVNLDLLGLVWHVQTGIDFPNPPEAGGGLVFAGSNDNNLYAFDAATGVQQWKFRTTGPVHSQPQYVNNVLYFGSDDGNLYVVKATDGTLLANVYFPSAQIHSFYYMNGVVYLAANNINGGFYAFQIILSSSGKITLNQLWSVAVENGAQQDPVIFGDFVYFTASNHTVYGLNIYTGDATWTYTPTIVAFAGPAIMVYYPTVGLNRTYDKVCWLGTHNAYANSADGWWYAQQSNNLVAQLDDGVRMLMLDVWLCTPVGGNSSVVLAHGGCAKTYLLQAFSAYVTFTAALNDIQDWLARNPNEIVTLYLEEMVNDASALMAAINASTINGSLFYADRTNTGSNGDTWNVGTQGWPTLQWMVNANLRVVIFSDRADDELPYVWDYAVENDYGDDSRNGQCNNRSKSKGIDKNPPALFIANYNTTFSTNPGNNIYTSDTYRRFDVINDYHNIIGIIDGCYSLRNNRLPNFLAVDWYEYGFDGGPRRAVKEINTRWLRS